MRLTTREKNHTVALKALKQVGLRIGMYGPFRRYPVLTDDQKYECLYCVAVIADKKTPFTAKMAASLMLDYYIPNWREIVGTEVVGNVVERDSKEVRKWRKDVLERDNHACVRCGSDQHLEVHHIAPWSEFPELRLMTNNGETLCNACHALEHENISGLILARVR